MHWHCYQLRELAHEGNVSFPPSPVFVPYSQGGDTESTVSLFFDFFMFEF
jgi:hypothetical protein